MVANALCAIAGPVALALAPLSFLITGRIFHLAAGAGTSGRSIVLPAIELSLV